MSVQSADGAFGLATEDEGRRPETTLQGLAELKTPFRPHGRVTAGTASPLTDGATISLLAGGQAVTELGLAPKMRMVSFAFSGVQPEIMGIGPIPSTEKALAKAGLSIEDIGLFELNEAFAVQVLSFLDHFGIDDDDPRVNQWGGAIALGHPLAASGVRLMIQLAAQFAERPDVRYGLTAMCVGLGQGGSVLRECPTTPARRSGSDTHDRLRIDRLHPARRRLRRRGRHPLARARRDARQRSHAGADHTAQRP